MNLAEIRDRLEQGRQQWQQQALCRGVDPAMFFPESGGKLQDEAIAICNTPCPVKFECLQYALDNGEEYGIWGGTTQRQRRKLWKDHLLPKRCQACDRIFFIKRSQSHHVYCTKRCAQDARNERNRLGQKLPAIPKMPQGSATASHHTHNVSDTTRQGGKDAPHP